MAPPVHEGCERRSTSRSRRKRCREAEQHAATLRGVLLHRTLDETGVEVGIEAEG